MNDVGITEGRGNRPDPVKIKVRRIECDGGHIRTTDDGIARQPIGELAVVANNDVIIGSARLGAHKRKILRLAVENVGAKPADDDIAPFVALDEVVTAKANVAGLNQADDILQQANGATIAKEDVLTGGWCADEACASSVIEIAVDVVGASAAEGYVAAAVAVDRIGVAECGIAGL